MNEEKAIKILYEHNIWRKGGEGEMITPALLSEAIDTIVDLFNERNAMKYYYIIFAYQKEENAKYHIATVSMKSNKEFNPYKAADIIKEQLKANDVMIRSWQEISETAYNSCDNE